MTFKSLTPNLMVEDVAATVAFYRDTLGFVVTAQAPEEGTPIWASLTADGVSLMFQARESLTEELPQLTGHPIGASQTLYIGVDDADALYTAIHAKAQIIKAPYTAVYNAREFYIQDPNGYLLCFSSPISGEAAPGQGE